MIPPPSMTLFPPEFVMPRTQLKLGQAMVWFQLPSHHGKYIFNAILLSSDEVTC
jgi:hypothetical protein